MVTLKMGSRPENIELALGCKPAKDITTYSGTENPDHGGVKSGIVDVKPEIVDVKPKIVGVKPKIVGVNTAIHHSRKERCSYIIRRMKDNPVITANDLSTILSASKRTIERDIAWLTGKQIITRTGADKNGRWIVLKEFEGDE